MSVREIKTEPGRRLGTVARSLLARKPKIIGRITVYRDARGSGMNVGLSVRDEGNKVDTYLSLSPHSSIEVVKGLLQNLPEVYVAADDELLAIFKEKIAAADRDAKAVVAAIRRPLTEEK